VSKTEQEVLKIAEQYNVGDVALGLKPTQRRETIGNRQALKGNIFPGEIINRNNPSKNYQFVWVPLGDDDYFADQKDNGYKPVVEGEWICARPGWDWETPDRDKFRWSETRLLIHRNRFAMYRDEEAWREAVEKRQNDKARDIRKHHEESIEIGAKHGVEVEATIDGKTERNKVGTRRVTVS